MPEPWPVPSPRVRELIRRGAEIALDPRAAWIEQVHEAALSGESMRPVAEDPVLSEEARRSNLANLLHWAAANVQNPGDRVPANVGVEALEIARDLVRRGLDESALDAYRNGQNVAWRRWMEICFELTRDPAELQEMLTVSSLSIATFVNDTLAAISERMQAEREELTRGTHAERRQAVTLLLEGAPIGVARAEAQLGYRLGGTHTALVVWSSTRGAVDRLEAVAELVRRESGATDRLTVIAGAGTLWVWLPIAEAPNPAPLSGSLLSHPDVRVALGRPGRGVAGFRRSHLDAVATQRMLTTLGSAHRVARFADVHLVTVLTRDPALADEFVADTLGDLATAEPDVRRAVLTYVRENGNTSRTAQRLYTHRNTVIRRLARADELLPRPLAEDVVGVAAALEVLHWRDPAG